MNKRDAGMGPGGSRSLTKTTNKCHAMNATGPKPGSDGRFHQIVHYRVLRIHLPLISSEILLEEVCGGYKEFSDRLLKLKELQLGNGVYCPGLDKLRKLTHADLLENITLHFT